MTRLDAAIGETMAWALTDSETLPDVLFGLLDLTSTGLADLGISLPEPENRVENGWIAAIYRTMAKLDAWPEAPGMSVRARTALAAITAHARYHVSAMEHLFGSIDRIADAAPELHDRALRVSLCEMLSHAANGFALLGSVPHCGPAGRALLPGPAGYPGPEPYAPPIPDYAYAGNSMARVLLNFGLPIFVDTGDDSVCPDIIRTGWWEPWIDGLVRKCVGRGDIAVNVGANVGYYMLLLARCVEADGRVYAFEGNPHLNRLLRRTLIWGGLMGMVAVFPAAASNQRGMSEFRFSRNYLGGGRIVDPSKNPNRIVPLLWKGLDEAILEPLVTARMPVFETHSVVTVTLDDTVGQLVECVHFMIIDVEGSEPDVLDGAKALIRRSPDLTLIVEWANGTGLAKPSAKQLQAREIIEWLHGEGFAFWRIEGDRRDVYTYPAILEPLSMEEVLTMNGYSDLFLRRRPHLLRELGPLA